MPSPQTGEPKRRLSEGNQLRCPKCGELGNPGFHFKPLDLVEEFKDELNLVQIHRKDRGGCGHAFSPGEPLILGKYLSGELVPVEFVKQLQNRIAELETALRALQRANQDDNSVEDERRAVNA